jgi:hypothetical protein
LAFGCVLRVTRLIALDTITQPLRNRLSGWIEKLATCGWCVSMWVSPLVAVSWWLWADHPVWQVAAVALSGSWLAGATFFAGMPARHEVEVTPVGPLVVFPPTPPQPGQEG